MARKRIEASSAEIQVLKVLWAGGAMTVRAVAAQLKREGHKWAYNTVLTFLRRLIAKRYVKSSTSDGSYYYRAVVSREQLIQHRLRQIGNDLADESMFVVARALFDDPSLTAAEKRKLKTLVRPTKPAAKANSAAHRVHPTPSLSSHRHPARAKQ